MTGALTIRSEHPWAILPALVTCDPPILTPEEAKGIVLAHENANQRAMMEIQALIPELIARELITPEGAQRISRVVASSHRREMPNL